MEIPVMASITHLVRVHEPLARQLRIMATVENVSIADLLDRLIGKAVPRTSDIDACKNGAQVIELFKTDQTALP